ncbi:MAG: UDP-N-acetylmuramate dehydrogenase [Micavibrio aeruginosavorus]|uniref:UDP-N-acetylenolpyruvoylglucosamine reductase n=1 Tax=Micavibrio aeruginosavorus TaxID=349221 RepID=A0A7T5R266_9BACT|nr:MAG: UDP-N-acetylmuramate dehydrogenase [Micavibrio aeruginosavorus]
MTAILKEREWGLPPVRGRYTENAPLGEVGWFRCGGAAEVLFKPADQDDLVSFLAQCPSHIPVTTLGVLSNTIVRDGGVRGVVIRLGKEFAAIETQSGGLVRAGAMALDGNVAQAAAKASVAGLEFFSGIPGTIGGALRMNAGCYGSETQDVLVEVTAVDRTGLVHKMTPADMGMSYRHTGTPEEYVFTEALFQGRPGKEDDIRAFMAGIKEKRGASQPIREKTGGSTFANPTAEEVEKAGLSAGTKVWQLIDRAGCRGLTIGGAMMSELHANFMINTGMATATALEALGEEVRRRVLADSGISLRWEIKRIGEPLAK